MKPQDMIQIDGDSLAVTFSRFDIETYHAFLEVKKLPEYTVEFDPQREWYTIRAPKRFASLLGADVPDRDVGDLPLSPFLYDDQAAITSLSLAAKRFAVWSDCGLGKSVIEFEFARQVIHRTGGRVLLITMNEIVGQMLDMVAEFYGDSLPVVRLTSREEMKAWCRGEGEGQFAITNYEKLNPMKDPADDQVVNEMRHLAGLILDESSRLKCGGGVQKWALIKSSKGIEYKLSCTATPAPNDWIEYASQASFLERMRSENDILWTFFHRDPKTKEWTVKRHARKAFFDFMASWSIYVRDPRKYGWRLDHQPVPEPIVTLHEIRPTPEQMVELQKFVTDKGGQMRLIQKDSLSVVDRAKISQIAKGFVYLKGNQGRRRGVESLKPAYVANLIAEELSAGLQTLVWTVFDAESDILAEELQARGIGYDLLTGKTPEAARLDILDRFRKGKSELLISRASMLGFGQNFQRCGSMIFSGWNDSYEAYYQAIRRAVRHGQTQRVRVHIPVIPELEGDMLDNIFDKEQKHLAAVAEMEANYVAALERLALSA